MQPICPPITKPSDIDYKSKRTFFGWLPIETVKHTFDHCTQHMQLLPSTHLQKHFKLPRPGANIFHRHKTDATDMINYNTPAIFGSTTQVHIFVGLVSCFTDVYKAKKRDSTGFLEAFQDLICTFGNPTKLITDNPALYQIWIITCYLCDIWMGIWQCKLKVQYQISD